MKYIPYYIVTIESYDYFGGYKFEYKKFDTLIEAWNFFKFNLKHVYHYDDGSFYNIYKPVIAWKWEKSKHIYHNIKWMNKITNPVIENIFDVFDMDDEPIII